MPLSLLNDELDLLALWLFEKLLLELSCRLEEENMLVVVDVISSESRFVLKNNGIVAPFYTCPVDNVVDGRAGRGRGRGNNKRMRQTMMEMCEKTPEEYR
jgi:hypothetical protein